MFLIGRNTDLRSLQLLWSTGIRAAASLCTYDDTELAYIIAEENTYNDDFGI